MATVATSISLVSGHSEFIQVIAKQKIKEWFWPNDDCRSIIWYFCVGTATHSNNTHRDPHNILPMWNLLILTFIFSYWLHSGVIEYLKPRNMKLMSKTKWWASCVNGFLLAMLVTCQCLTHHHNLKPETNHISAIFGDAIFFGMLQC